MKLTRIEAEGFKSFADKVTLNFDGGVVGIVGPNGSGKSNINDAIKWVLGEQSSKSLRGDNMDDIVFAGSKTMLPSKYAEVTLTFDNSELLTKIPHKIIKLTRKYKKGSGKNDYYINGDLARLKDVKEIAMHSGMAKSSLAIISQGTISDIAESSPEDRRGIFEEAAGVSVYKSRKLEASRKLGRTQDALDKVDLVVAELDRQLKPLKRQAEKAKIYLEKKEQLHSVELGLIVEDTIFYDQKLTEVNKELGVIEENKSEFQNKINFLEKDITSKNNMKFSIENDLIILEEEIKNIKDKLMDFEHKSSQSSQRRQMIIDGDIQATPKSILNAQKEQLQELNEKIIKYKIMDQKLTKEVNEKRNVVHELESNHKKYLMNIDNHKSKIMKVRLKLETLKDRLKNRSNLNLGVKTILKNIDLFNGVHGIVADNMKSDAKINVAIETIMGKSLQNIIVDNSQIAIDAINFLKQNNSGRATFVTLEDLKPKGIKEQYRLALNSKEGFVGIASDLVEVKPKYNLMKEFFLGTSIIATDSKAMDDISRFINRQHKVVSLDGDVANVGGIISGGQRNEGSQILGLDSQIKKLEEVLPIIDNELKKMYEESGRIFHEVSENNVLISETFMETAKIREKSANIESQFMFLKSKYESSSNEKFIAENKEVSIDNEKQLEEKKTNLQITISAKKNKLFSMNKELSNEIEEKGFYEKQLREIIVNSSSKFDLKNQAEFFIKQASERLIGEYQMTFDTIKDKYSLENVDREKARVVVKRIRTEITDLGNVNIDSIEQYEEESKRFEVLNINKKELEDAKNTINSAIDQMDKIIIKRIDQIVKAVNVEFNNVFVSLFGGGNAFIRYTDSKNLLSTGIDVIAQPPGKTVKNIKLFSGGEKAMIAISLLFAILKAKPLPLSILDEVEAALDEANVIRYAEYLQKLKHQTQFIAITHRIPTMERVDYLFGATMQNRGVTSFFTVKLEEAKKIIEN